MGSMLVAKLAKLLYFQLAGLVLFILSNGIIPSFTFLARQQNDLSHMLILSL